MSWNSLDRDYRTGISKAPDAWAATKESTGYSESDFYPVKLKNGWILSLPFKVFPDGKGAIANLNAPQADLEVVDAVSEALADQLNDLNPEVIIALSGQGQIVGEQIARRFGHPNFVPLTNSVKFWQDPELRQPVTSVTSRPKDLYLDPFLAPRIRGRRAVLIDEVANTGGSLRAAVQLAMMAEPADLHIGVVLTEGHDWEDALRGIGFDPARVRSAGSIPVFDRNQAGLFVARQTTL